MPVNVDAQLKPVILTPGELVAALSLCGYDTIATSLLQEHSLVASDEEADRFLFQAETLLRERGYFQESRPNFLPKGLDSFIHVLVKSKRKCRCVSGVKKIVLHSLPQQNTLLQTFDGTEYSFLFLRSKKTVHDTIKSFFETGYIPNTPFDALQPIVMDSDSFNRLSTATPEAIRALMEESDASGQAFLRGLLHNRIALDNITFLEADFVKDETHIDQVQFLLPQKEFVWHLHYGDIRTSNTIRLEPIAKSVYFERVLMVVDQWFTLDR